jgi:hypothetical protein
MWVRLDDDLNRHVLSDKTAERLHDEAYAADLDYHPTYLDRLRALWSDGRDYPLDWMCTHEF